jgi:(p)ppGpp synthase/HD superfamily hydrolase
MNESECSLQLTGQFTRAVEYARELHTEYRKGTCVPYMAHLLGVASLVLGEAGGPVPITENMVIAAILHDVVEDHGGRPRLEALREEFGEDVARMVAGLSDTFAEGHNQKEGWEERKNAYLTRLQDETEDVLLISAADKLYNAKSILDDFRQIGPKVWVRFQRGSGQQLWYFNALLAIFRARLPSRIVAEFARIVGELESQCEAAASRQ